MARAIVGFDFPAAFAACASEYMESPSCRSSPTEPAMRGTHHVPAMGWTARWQRRYRFGAMLVSLMYHR
jgi:hypothetical protein